MCQNYDLLFLVCRSVLELGACLAFFGDLLPTRISFGKKLRCKQSQEYHFYFQWRSSQEIRKTTRVFFNHNKSWMLVSSLMRLFETQKLFF